VLVAPSSFLIFFVLDHGKKPFDDVRVRQAANLAVNRDQIVKSVLGGLGVPATAPLGNGVLGRSEFEPWPYDPNKAKQLLAEAGYAGASIPDAYWNLVNNVRTNGYYPNSYSNAKVDALLEEASRTSDDAARHKVYTEIQRIVFQEDAAMLYLHGQRRVLGHRSTGSGLNPLPFEIFLATLDVN
jgi:ABC-type transport system substrate-binding protein